MACEHIRVRGLMTMAPIGSAEVARECFCGLAKLHAQLKSELDASSVQHFNELSMGMSQDWQEGVRAGATIVRIGRAVFSPTFA